jgi:RNA polymerase subunit RPABC4/transcription elongation factor Spt4
MYILILLLAHSIISGCLSWSLAKKKGHDAGAWFACGFFFGILGLIAAAGLPTVRASEQAERRKLCSDCAESVGKDARVCPYCGHRFTDEEERTELLAALNSDDADTRRLAIEGLTQQTGRRVTGRLVEALDDPDVAVRVAAIEALGRVGDKSVALRITDVLENASESWGVDWHLALENAASKALQELGSEALVPKLAALVAVGGPFTNRKLQAVEVLSAIGGPAAARVLVKALGDESVARQAAAGLERMGEVAIPHLEQAMETGSRAARKAAEKLLGTIRAGGTQ